MRPDLFWGSVVSLAVLLLFTNGQRISKQDKDKITKGLEAGKGLASALSDGNFQASLRNFGARSSAFLGALGPLVAFAFSFIPGGSNNGLQKLYEYMKKEFDIINQKLDTLPLRFEEVRKLIDWRSLQTNYGVYERNIQAAEDKLNRYFKVSRQGRTHAKEAFMRIYDNGVAGSTQKLYNGVVNHRQILSQNIIAAVIKKTGCYKKKVESFGLGLTQLILQGIKIELAYYTFNGWSTADLEKEWAGKLKKFCGVLLQASEKCKSGYYRQMRKDVNKLIIDNSGQKPKEIRWTIYNFLVAKYDWRYWMVVAYNGVRGYDKHTINTCGGGYWLSRYGKNIIVASQDKSVRYFQRSRAQEGINRMNNHITSACTRYLRPVGYNGKASGVANVIRHHVGRTCSQFALVLVVRRFEPIYYVSWKSRRYLGFVHVKDNDGAWNCVRMRYHLLYNVLFFG